MKKIDLVHTTILIIALLTGYTAITNIISLLSMFTYYNSYISENLTYFFILTIGYAIICVILIKNGRRYAGFLLKDEPEASWEDASNWDIDRPNLLLVLFIGMGLYIMTQSIPNILVAVYDAFSAKVGALSLLPQSSVSKKPSLIIELLRGTLGAFLIYAAPTLTNFIEKTIAVRLDNHDSKP